LIIRSDNNKSINKFHYKAQWSTYGYISLNKHIHRVHKKVSQKFSDYKNLKVVKEFPSELAYSIHVLRLMMRHKNYPLQLMYVCTVKIVTKHKGVISLYCKQKLED